MMSRHFRLSSELTGTIAKRLLHAKNQLSVPGSFFNQFVTDIYIYIYTHINRVLIVRIYHRRRIHPVMGWIGPEGLPDWIKAYPIHSQSTRAVYQAV